VPGEDHVSPCTTLGDQQLDYQSRFTPIKNPRIFRFWGCFGIIVLLLAATLSSTPLCWQFHAAI